MPPVASRQLIPSLLFSCVHIVQTLPPGSALISTSKDHSCNTFTPFFTTFYTCSNFNFDLQILFYLPVF
ncbi:unnamed protein product [Caenorhabditis nigoni]